ncbi:SARP family transcriptional regulator [Paracoccus sp. WLY502]|uniref:SARP family transcriptional regulator n=1 Tax=Paracoccus yibinensis TaxID=3068891 RepID=UPI0027966974|nr:SARP family transcriptional regulator [Paracoccus sp. WLY502]MDQ1901323.1 SARP family transcriptional regulator [Paracoccus sp. WLY502]
MLPLTLRLMGPVELIGPGNLRLTPRGMRARGALAVMGSATSMRILRARLQDLLFSTREPENANASLRQVLREIRISLGDARDALLSGPGWVGLDGGIIRLDMTARPGPDGQMPEFAADLDIPDPEFEDWLRDARMHAEQAVTPSALKPSLLPVLLTAEPVAGNTETGVIAAIILGEAAGRVCDLVPMVAMPDRADPGQSAIVLSAVANRVGQGVHLLVKLTHRPSSRLFWSHKFVLDADNLAAAMSDCTAQVCVGVMRVLEAVRTIDAALGVSFGDVFSFNHARLARAEQALAGMDDGVNASLTMALRAWVRTTQVFERLVPDPQGIIQEAQEFATRAREADPYSATALGVASVVEGYMKHGQVSFWLAQQAVQADAKNPLARYAYSRALTDLGRHEEAYREAQAGLAEALSVLNPATWQMRMGIALTRLGRYEEAEQRFDAVQQFAPENRPSLRFLAALRYHRRDEAGALSALQALRRVEPGFTLEAMRSDGYPVATLRQGGLLGVTRSGLI